MCTTIYVKYLSGFHTRGVPPMGHEHVGLVGGDQ